MISRVVLDRFAGTMGYNGALLALAAYGTITLPKMRINVFGLSLSWFGFFILEALHYISFNAEIRSVVSLLFDCFLVGMGVVFFFKLLHPNYVFTLGRVKEMTLDSILP